MAVGDTSNQRAAQGRTGPDVAGESRSDGAGSATRLTMRDFINNSKAAISVRSKNGEAGMSAQGPQQ